MNIHLENRKGALSITKEFYYNMSLAELKLLHSNFYLCHITDDINNFGVNLMIYGYSEHFNKVNLIECEALLLYSFEMDLEAKTISFNRL